MNQEKKDAITKTFAADFAKHFDTVYRVEDRGSNTKVFVIEGDKGGESFIVTVERVTD